MIVNTLNFNESAPCIEELLNNARNISNFALKNNQAFDFGIDFLDKYFEGIIMKRQLLKELLPRIPWLILK